MVSHRQIWGAIDALAERHHLSASGLARLAGLDATAFNKSKRETADGRKRWPSTESLAKILEATGAGFEEFSALVNRAGGGSGSFGARLIPLIGFARAGSGGFFDDGGFPVGAGWEQVAFPQLRDENAYALEVSGDSMAPVYRDGDIIIVSPAAGIRRGDRVVVKTTDGEILAKMLARQTARTLELVSFNPAHEDRTLNTSEVEWMARIIWASQ